MASLEGIEAGALVGKYRVQTRLTTGERAAFRATAEESGEAVRLLELRTDEVAALAAAVRAEHAHLARVLEVVHHDGIPLLVFEHVEGTSLTSRLLEVGQKPQVDAVRSALRVADALSTLHEADGVHGFIHTDSVLLDPEERLGPILTFAPVPSDERTFHSPERGESGRPSVADDAWATAGLLHMMLTGKPPPKEGYGTELELEQAGVEDAALRAALLHGLHRDANDRSSDVRPLKRELARWYVEHAGEELVAVNPRSTRAPPPLPPSRQGGTRKTPRVERGPLPPNSKRRRPRVALLAAGGTLLGLGAAWAFSTMSARPSVKLVERPAAASMAPEAKPVDLSEVPVTGEGQNIDIGKTASCVASYLPKGAFVREPQLGWLCEELNPTKGAEKLRVAVVAAAPTSGGPTDAMKIFSRLGWYDMAAFAIIRTGCCEDPQALSLPDAAGSCDSLPDALRDIGREVIANKSYDEPLKRYSGSLDCLFSAGRGPALGRAQRPQPAEAAAFQELVEAMAR
ncbi:MAG TPA: protein kinase [Polyangiaceae bacterium]|nr:protein kinase [Polyangiaceae bacterium]